MEGLMSHVKGSHFATLQEVEAVPVPAETDTYMPIAHGELAQNIRHIADDMLVPKGYGFNKDQYVLGTKGQRVFGIMQYGNGTPDLGLAIGWRNSYDKSMAAGICLGVQVFVCDNLAFHGDITVLRRHTKNLHDDLSTQLLGALYKSQGNYLSLKGMAEHFRQTTVSDREGFKMLGCMRGEGILSPTLESRAFEQWQTPEFEDFQPRTAWSLYNAATYALKAAPVDQQFELHTQLSDLCMATWPAARN